MLQYRAIVHRGDGQFWIELPDFPEITHHGSLDEEDPADAAAECLADAILLRLFEKEPLPEASPLPAPGERAAEEFLVAPLRRDQPQAA